MANVKTALNDGSVSQFIDSIEDEVKRKDCEQLLNFASEITGEVPQMWGKSIVGFGSYHYKYESGREGDWFLTGFSPRKQSLTLYIMPGFEKYGELLNSLGNHKTGKACLYVKRLSDIDTDVLKELIAQSVAYMRNKYHQ